MAGDFKDLDVYRLAMQIGRNVHNVVAQWSSFHKWTLGIQLVRAADSVAANLAEAYGRGTARDRIRFLHIARGSARETECLIEKVLERELLPSTADLDPRDAEKVSRMLSGLIAANKRSTRVAR